MLFRFSEKNIKKEKGKYYTQARIIKSRELLPPKGRHWTFSQKKIDILEGNEKIRINSEISYTDLEGNKIIGLPEYYQSEETPVDTTWTDLKGYAFGSTFQTENAEELLKRVIEFASNKGELVFDYFLGSGTTTAVAHKLRRKWIGIEIGNHFWTVVIPRMKKVLFYDQTGISREKDVKENYNKNNAGGFFKYQVLEQYEDTLDNIELVTDEAAQQLFQDDYLLKYFLDFETRENATLLNVKSLKRPFSYRLRVNFDEVGELEESFSGHEADLLEDVYLRIFGGKGNFRIYELRNAGGELGLKAGENAYFGVVNIGNVSDFNWES